jgi:hypothetical protein
VVRCFTMKCVLHGMTYCYAYLDHSSVSCTHSVSHSSCPAVQPSSYWPILVTRNIGRDYSGEDLQNGLGMRVLAALGIIANLQVRCSAATDHFFVSYDTPLLCDYSLHLNPTLNGLPTNLLVSLSFYDYLLFGPTTVLNSIPYHCLFTLPNLTTLHGSKRTLLNLIIAFSLFSPVDLSLSLYLCVFLRFVLILILHTIGDVSSGDVSHPGYADSPAD